MWARKKHRNENTDSQTSTSPELLEDEPFLLFVLNWYSGFTIESTHILDADNIYYG